ncbi:hypothetical protein CAEBREN_11215 [Caenorhabditis brenneri]|uniref:Uncharacterized protein n=1 Tax=Caenorhabditis brenneri TaxID=135651 RepID=G0P5Q7_CAEBE|nr:hypothetical protein CAEBREN_11215 [Caenorhabditis brenneri]
MATAPKIKLPLLMLKLMMKYEYLKKNPENIARERALLVMFNTSEDVKQRICDAWQSEKHDERLKNREDKEDEQEKRDEQEGKDGGEDESGEPPAKKSKRDESSSGSSDRETTESQLQRISSEESDEVVPEDDASDYGDRQSFEEAPGARMLHSEEPEQSPYDFQEGSSEGSTPNPMHPRSYSESGQQEGSPAFLRGVFHSSNAPTPEGQASSAEESSAEASTPEESTASSDGSATPSDESPVEVSAPEESESNDDPWKDYQIFPSGTDLDVIKIISKSLNEDWYYTFQRKDDNNIRKQDDTTKDKIIFKLLFNRKLAGHSEGLEFVEFPIDTIKIVIGYGKISIMVNPEEPAEEKRLELAFLHHDDGLLMWENGEVRLVERSTYYDFAASYAKTLMQFPKQPIKKMIFDIEPYTNGPKVYSDYNKFYKEFEELEGARWKKIRIGEEQQQHEMGQEQELYPDIWTPPEFEDAPQYPDRIPIILPRSYFIEQLNELFW